MKQIKAEEIDPLVLVANYFQVSKNRETWGPRVINDIELIYIVQGIFEFSSNGDKLHILSPGNVLCIFPGEEHTFRRKPGTDKGIISCIHLEPVRSCPIKGGSYTPDPQPERVTVFDPEDGVEEQFRLAAQILEQPGRFRALRSASIVKLIWLTLAEKWKAARLAEEDPRIERIIRFVREHLHQSITRNTIAQELGYSREYVNRLFKNHLGLTPTVFIQSEKMYHAFKLLQEEGLSVKEVSRRVGFTDQFYFSRVFKTIIGIPPSQV